VPTRFGARSVHRQFDAELRRAEIFASVSGSGSGKSTLLRVLRLTLLRRDAGSISVPAQPGRARRSRCNRAVPSLGRDGHARWPFRRAHGDRKRTRHCGRSAPMCSAAEGQASALCRQRPRLPGTLGSMSRTSTMPCSLPDRQHAVQALALAECLACVPALRQSQSRGYPRDPDSVYLTSPFLSA
jgi:ABC-type cobalamin/Fe3+-siderophores transport system ATPase subunit